MIDWTKPIELLDGTPVSLGREREQPDRDGDYWIEREDGGRIPSLEPKRSFAFMCVHPDGREEGTDTVILRNRNEAGTTPAKTLRDEFAMAALTGLLASEAGIAPYSQEWAAERAYLLADAMMVERAKGDVG